VDGGQGQEQEPRPWSVTHHRRGTGPHRPWAIAKASYKKQRRNVAVTEILKIPGRGHSLIIDHGWKEVADASLNFIERFAKR